MRNPSAAPANTVPPDIRFRQPFGAERATRRVAVTRVAAYFSEVEQIHPKQYLYRRIVRAKLFIDEHFASALDLSQIADEACFSKFHFVRLFRNTYGKTPHQYLTEVRINRAKRLLADGAAVKYACFAVGFDSVGSFTGLFRRRVGKTPAEFQRCELARREEIGKRPLKFVPNCFVEKRGWGK